MSPSILHEMTTYDDRETTAHNIESRRGATWCWNAALQLVRSPTARECPQAVPLLRVQYSQANVPNKMAVQCESWNVLARSSTVVMASNPVRKRNVCVNFVFALFEGLILLPPKQWGHDFESQQRNGCMCFRLLHLFSCVPIRIATSWSPIQGVLQTACRIQKLKKLPRANEGQYSRNNHNI
jgi:hypothetical protein